MSPRSTRLDDSVRALRELTAQPRDGEVTRARVLVVASANVHRRRRLWRILPIVVVVGIALGSVAGAFTAGHHLWRSPVQTGLHREASAGPTGGERSTPAALPAAATTAIESQPPPERGEEYALYARAHEAHFRGKIARAALAAWDEYLLHHPGGAFAPEAHFNRAICLLRLGRNASAAVTLRRFAQGRFAGYRRAEACALLRRLGEPIPDGCPL
jgi:hypothetical protein